MTQIYYGANMIEFHFFATKGRHSSQVEWIHSQKNFHVTACGDITFSLRFRARLDAKSKN
jgi:hypothetical protein